MGVVYLLHIRASKNLERIYIGQTMDFHRRLNEHICTKRNLGNIVKTEILFESPYRMVIEDKEKFYIHQYADKLWKKYKKTGMTYNEILEKYLINKQLY